MAMEEPTVPPNSHKASLCLSEVSDVQQSSRRTCNNSGHVGAVQGHVRAGIVQHAIIRSKVLGHYNPTGGRRHPRGCARAKCCTCVVQSCGV